VTSAFRQNIGFSRRVSYHQCASQGANEHHSVSTTTRRFIKDTDLSKARDGWMEYVWRHGGGLPLLVLQNEPTRRSQQKPNNQHIIHYEVTNNGIFSFDMIDCSHSATVEFFEEKEGVQMVWKVNFQVQSRPAFWKAFTEINVGVASDNLVSYLAKPRRITVETIIPGCSPENVMNAWIDFVWARGGNLPFVFPIGLGNGLRAIPPIILLEKIVESNFETHQITYRVENPSPFTYPAHFHLATVDFFQTEEQEGTRMLWNVNFTPYHNCGAVVHFFTETVVSSLSRNLQKYLLK